MNKPDRTKRQHAPLKLQPDSINPEILYEVIGLTSPAVAWGNYHTATFDFRAKYDHWDFVLSPFPDFPATLISDLTWHDLDLVQQSEKPVPADWVQAFRSSFVRQGKYGQPGKYDASYMPKHEIARIVRECIGEYERVGLKTADNPNA